jgi:sugar phosphate isomerase/epimerase
LADLPGGPLRILATQSCYDKEVCVYTRRDFGKLALASTPLLSAAAAVKSTFGGVRIGVQSASFTFSGLGIDDIIKTMVEVGIAETDVMSEHVDNYLGGPVSLPGAGRSGPWARQRGGGAGAPPPDARGRGTGSTEGAGSTAPGRRPGGAVPGRGFARDPAAREALRKWRLTTPLDGFRAVGAKFRGAGLVYFSHNLSFRDDFTDEEIERGFQMAEALGTRIITASSPLTVFPRLVPFAEKYDFKVALHNHGNGPEDFAKITAISKHFWINLDVGHFLAAGHDPIAFIKANHARITNIHLKDRKKDNGPEMPFGQGDTPLKEILQLLKRERYRFPADIELVGPAGPKVELTTCLQFCKNALS